MISYFSTLLKTDTPEFKSNVSPFAIQILLKQIALKKTYQSFSRILSLAKVLRKSISSTKKGFLRKLTLFVFVLTFQTLPEVFTNTQTKPINSCSTIVNYHKKQAQERDKFICV